MNNLTLLAYRSYGYGHSSGMVGWLTHVLVSAVIHGLIYALIFKVMHNLTLGQAAVLVVVVIGVIFMWGRSRRRSVW